MSDLTEAQQQAQAALEKVMNCRFNNFDAGAVIHWAERGFYQVKAEAASRISQQDAELERWKARAEYAEANLAETRRIAFVEAGDHVEKALGDRYEILANTIRHMGDNAEETRT